MPAQKWRVLALMMTLQAFVVGIGMYSFTFWVEPWREEFGANRREIMTAISLMMYASGVMSLFTGRWIDFYPAKYIVTAGMGTFMIGMLLVSVAPSLTAIWIIFALVLPASNAACGPLVSMVLVSRGFVRRRGLALSIVTLGTSIGGIFFPGFIAYLLGEIGWRPSFVILGLMGGALMPLCWWVLRGEPVRETAHARAGNDGGRFRDFSSQRAFWVLAAIYLSTWFLFSSVQHNTHPYANDIGIGTEGSASFLSALALCMVIGKLIIGPLADKWDNRYLFMAAGCQLVVGVLLLSVATSYTAALVAYIIIGIAAGGFLPLQGALFAMVFGPDQMGRAMGMASPIQSLSALGAFFAGWYRDELGTYTTYFQIAAVVFFVTVPLLLLLPRRARGSLAAE